MDGVADWYLLGLALGLAVAAGVGALLARARLALGLAAAAVAGGASVAVVLLALPLWSVALVAIAALVGFVALRGLSASALPFAFLSAAGLAVVPALGFVEALAVPVVGGRVSRRAGRRYAGL